MGIARSTFYDKPATQDDTAIVAAISTICEEFEFYAGGAFAPSFRGAMFPSSGRAMSPITRSNRQRRT